VGYCLLRLKGSPGYTTVGSASATEATAALRGWISVPEEPPSVTIDQALSVMQYPENASPELVAENKTVIAVDDTHLEYRVTGNRLRPTAAGSPCFDAKLQLVAVQLAANVSRRLGVREQTTGQCILLHAILQDLDRQGMRSLLYQRPV
jgi:hypothetical protein